MTSEVVAAGMMMIGVRDTLFDGCGDFGDWLGTAIGMATGGACCCGAGWALRAGALTPS